MQPALLALPCPPPAAHAGSGAALMELITSVLRAKLGAERYSEVALSIRS